MPPTALVIGLGYLGSSIIPAFLEAGWAVRAVARSQGKADAWTAKSASLSRQLLSMLFVDSAETPGALDQAMSDVDVVVNCSAMIPREWQYERTGSCAEGLRKVLDATIEPMRSAARSSSVRRFVYIGSGSNVGPACRDDSWLEITAEEAAEQVNRSSLYPNSKTLAEQAAFDFVKTERPSFDLVSLNPTMCLGPRGGQIVDPRTPFFGNVGRFERLLLHRGTAFAEYGFAAPRTVVDVRDVAKACVLAATHDLARGNRFLLRMSDIEALRLCKSRFGDATSSMCHVPDHEEPAADRYVSGELASEALGFRYRPVETTIMDMAAELLGTAV